MVKLEDIYTADEILAAKAGEAKNISYGENRKGGYKRFYAAEKEGWECPLCHVILGDGDVEPYDHIKIHSAATEEGPLLNGRCPQCDGTGFDMLSESPCPRCDGTGELKDGLPKATEGDSEDHSHQWVGTPAVCEICGRSWKGIQTELSPNGGWREAKATEGLYEDYISTFGDSSSLGGGFGDALQNGDLCEAWTRADLENRERLKTITGRTEEDLNDSCYDNKPNYFGDEAKATEYQVICPNCSKTYDTFADDGKCEYCGQDNNEFYGDGSDIKGSQDSQGGYFGEPDKSTGSWHDDYIEEEKRKGGAPRINESKATEGGWCNKCQRDTGQGWSYSNKTSHMKRVHPEVPRSEWNSLDYWGSAVGGADNYIGDDAAKTYYEPGGRFEQEMGRTVNESKANEYSIQEEYDLQDEYGKWEMLSKADAAWGMPIDAEDGGWTHRNKNYDDLPQHAKSKLHAAFGKDIDGGTGYGEGFISPKQFTCSKCGKVGTGFSEMAQEICPENAGGSHSIPIFGDMEATEELVDDTKSIEELRYLKGEDEFDDERLRLIKSGTIHPDWMGEDEWKSQDFGWQSGGESWTEEDEQDYRDEQNFDPPFPEEEEANEDLTPKDIEDYYASQDKDVGEDDQELLDFYASMSQEGHTEIADDDEIINWINTKPSDINIDSSDIMDRYDITRDEAFKLIDKANSIKYGEEVDFSTKHLGGNPNADSSEDEILNWINNDHLTGEPSDQFEDDVGSGRSIVNSLFDRHSLDHMINESKAGEYEVDIQDGVAEEDLEDNAGLNTSDNQAGNVFNCPSCGFKTHNRDEYDVHNDTHGNVPATVKTPLSEENIAVQNNDYQLLSRFKQ